MQSVEISKKTIESVLSYMGSRPYAEVAKLISDLAQEVRASAAKEEGKAEKKD